MTSGRRRPEWWVRTRSLGRLGWLLFLRDFRFRYRQTYLGYLWAAVRILANAVPIILVGSQFNLGAGKTAVAYPLYALAGVVMWQVFWDSVNYPQWIGRRLRKMFVETTVSHDVLLVAAAWYTLFNAAMYLVLLGIALALFRVPPPVSVVLGLMALPGLIVAGLTIGAVVAPLTFVFLDFRYGLPFLSQALLWTAPIFYAPPESGVLHVINTWNPLTYLLDVPRHWFVAGLRPGDWTFPVVVAAFVGCFTLTLRFYRRSMPVALQCVAAMKR